MNKITLTNLTQYQVEMLDMMWSLDSFEEFTEWQDSLDAEDKQLSQSLADAVRQSAMDEIIDCTEANQVLAQFRL